MVVILCICYCARCYSTYLFYTSKMRHHRVLLHCVEFAENVLFGRYGVPCYHKDQRLSSVDQKKNTPTVLDTSRNDFVYKPLARSDDYSKIEQLSPTVLAFRLDGFLLTPHQHMALVVYPAGQFTQWHDA